MSVTQDIYFFKFKLKRSTKKFLTCGGKLNITFASSLGNLVTNSSPVTFVSYARLIKSNCGMVAF